MIDKRFTYNQPNEKSIVELQLVRNKANELYELINTVLKESREKSITITKLEEVAMWANKAIVHNQG